MFDKSSNLFPVKQKLAYFSHCSISPLFSRAREVEQDLAQEHQNTGALMFIDKYDDVIDSLHQAAGKLLRTGTENVSFVKNTSEAISMIAGGYPFKKGDEVVVYTNEYPANFYPWVLQEKKGVKVIVLGNTPADLGGADGDMPVTWSIPELERVVTPRTRIIAVSHVQFTSGYAVDLPTLAGFCGDRDIDLVIDAAQSLGSLPIYPDELGIAAIASSGWKWLLGPIGTGLFYSSPNLRDKLDPVVAGAELMQQGTDYLDHTWNPHGTGRMFEYSTSPITLAAALDICIRELPLRYGVETVKTEIFRLQNLLIDTIDRDLYQPLVPPDENRSGILALKSKTIDPQIPVKRALEGNVVLSARGGLIRFAPHFYNDEREVERAVSLLNSL